jgi:hypothetical protein
MQRVSDLRLEKGHVRVPAFFKRQCRKSAPHSRVPILTSRSPRLHDELRLQYTGYHTTNPANSVERLGLMALVTSRIPQSLGTAKLPLIFPQYTSDDQWVISNPLRLQCRSPWQVHHASDTHTLQTARTDQHGFVMAHWCN